MLRPALIAPLTLGLLASAALAQIDPKSPQPKAPVEVGKKKVGNAVEKQSDGADSLTTCLAMWDAATHMSRQEWARACRRVADRLKNTAVR
jgi:hypothetical protein